MQVSITSELNNIDVQFKQVSNSDFNIDQQNMATTVASITTREIQEIDSPFNDMFMKVDIPDAYRVDAKSFIERPFYVDEVTFPDTAARYELLTSAVKFLPGDIARSNPSVLNMFKMASYGRPDLMLNISMAGTITHAGCILVGVLPPMPAYPTLNGQHNKNLINTILSGPHAFLYANEATSVAIPVPWYCNTDLATTDMEQSVSYSTTLDITTTNGNYATLVYMVLNPLRPSTGSSKSLRIIVEACFKNFDLAVPTPRYVNWVAQGGKLTKSSPPVFHDNPNYGLDDIANMFGIERIRELPPRKRDRLMKRIKRLAPYVGITATLLGVLVRLGVGCLLGDELPFDDTLMSTDDEEFEAQSSVVKGVKDLATGLLDSTFAGLKVVASDALDAGRGLIRQYTGLHNPNNPEIHERVIMNETNFANYTDVPQYFEKLDPFVKYNRIVKEPIFGSGLDEMAISNIVTKKQFVGSFTVKTTDNVGVMKWARPISPFHGGIKATDDQARFCANNLELLHSFSRGWRGDLKLTIQSVMNNKQQCKLKVIKMYNPSVRVASAYPEYKTVVNAPTHLLEFTEGGQEHEVELPYLCRNDITPCATNMDTEAMFHGIYYIYVAQPLVVSDSSPLDVEFNVYLSGAPDLTFYGYTTANTYHDSYSVIPDPLNQLSASEARQLQDLTQLDVTRFKPRRTYWKNADDPFKMAVDIANGMRDDKIDYDSKKWTPEQAQEVREITTTWADVMAQASNLRTQLVKLLGKDVLQQQVDKWEFDNRGACVKVNLAGLTNRQAKGVRDIMDARGVFRAQSGSIKVMNEPQKQNHVTRVETKTPQLLHMTRLMPSLDIRHFVRRMYKSQSYLFGIDPSSTKNINIPLASYLGEMPNAWNYTPIETFSRMYYGKSVGFKFRAVVSLKGVQEGYVSNVDLLNLRIYYLPQNVNALIGTKTITSAVPQLPSFTDPYSPTDGIPLPFQIISSESTTTHQVYEFAVPDTSFYKFMGGPNKFYNFETSSDITRLSQCDFGHIIMQYSNLSAVHAAIYSIELFVGLTDESRMGYHTAAPPFVVYKEDAFYLGDNNSSLNQASSTLNPFIYRGGFL